MGATSASASTEDARASRSTRETGRRGVTCTRTHTRTQSHKTHCTHTYTQARAHTMRHKVVYASPRTRSGRLSLTTAGVTEHSHTHKHIHASGGGGRRPLTLSLAVTLAPAARYFRARCAFPSRRCLIRYCPSRSASLTFAVPTRFTVPGRKSGDVRPTARIL